MRLRRSAWILAALLWLFVFSVGPVQAAVVISSFTAQASSGQVLVRWETASEIDVSGFFIQRSTQVDGAYTRVSSFFIGMGDGVSGYAYEYLDSGLTNGVTYYYKLEVLDNNQVMELYGPLSAVPGLPTPTKTATPTRTNTSTPTLGASATRSATPNSTATLGNGTPAMTPVMSSLTPTFVLATLPTSGLPGDPQPSPTPDFQAATPTLGTDPTQATPMDASSPTSDPAQLTPSFEAPLEEEPQSNIFGGDLILWLGLILGALALGAIVVLVFWSLNRRAKAG